MKIAFFSTKSYDREFFNRYVTTHDIIYFEAGLDTQTVNLAAGCDAVCVFVNDRLNAAIITGLKKSGVKLIALRCAGFNNVDLDAARTNGIKVVRVPAYSPHAVAEHAVALIMTLNRKTHKISCQQLKYNGSRNPLFNSRRMFADNIRGKFSCSL